MYQLATWPTFCRHDNNSLRMHDVCMQKLRKLLIFRRIFSKVAIATATENQKYLYGKKLLPSTLCEEIFHRNLCKFQKSSNRRNILSYSLRGSNFLFFLAENLSPVIRKGKILRQFENFKTYQNLYGKPFNRDWLTRVMSFTEQDLLIIGGPCNRYYTAKNVQVTRF